MPGFREEWFPTSVWYFDWPEAEQHNSGMIKQLYELQKEDEVGITDRSTMMGWHSHDDLQDQDAFRPLAAQILANAAEVGEFECWDLKRFMPYIINCWGIINPKLAFNLMHNHPNSLISGVYYLKTPEKSGDLVFRDPREVRLMQTPPVTGHHRATYKSVFYKPVTGRMLFFPSWLLHSVRPNQSDEDRICISFNLELQRK